MCIFPLLWCDISKRKTIWFEVLNIGKLGSNLLWIIGVYFQISNFIFSSWQGVQCVMRVCYPNLLSLRRSFVIALVKRSRLAAKWYVLTFETNSKNTPLTFFQKIKHKWIYSLKIRSFISVKACWCGLKRIINFLLKIHSF